MRYGYIKVHVIMDRSFTGHTWGWKERFCSTGSVDEDEQRHRHWPQPPCIWAAPGSYADHWQHGLQKLGQSEPGTVLYEYYKF